MTIEIIIAIVFYAAMIIFLYLQRTDPMPWRYFGKYLLFVLLIQASLAVIGTVFPGFGFNFRSLLNPYLYIYLLPLIVIVAGAEYRKKQAKLKASAAEKK